MVNILWTFLLNPDLICVHIFFQSMIVCFDPIRDQIQKANVSNQIFIDTCDVAFLANPNL